MTLFQTIRLIWHLGKSTKIKLITLDSIGIDEGYFACKKEEYEYIKQWHIDLENMSISEAKRLLEERGKKVERKYFGPKFVRE